MSLIVTNVEKALHEHDQMLKLIKFCSKYGDEEIKIVTKQFLMEIGEWDEKTLDRKRSLILFGSGKGGRQKLG